MKFEKVKESRIVLYICAFIIPFVMMMIFWKICGIYPFGEHSILTGDMDVEFVNFYTYFINTFKTKNDWSYMLTKTIGGDYPGLVHLRADGDSFEVTGIDLVKDGMDYSSSANQIFGEKEGLAEKFWNSDEKQEEARADFLKMYIRDNNLDIDAYQDYGWDPVPLK